MTTKQAQHTPGPWLVGEETTGGDDFQGHMIEAGDLLEDSTEREHAIGVVFDDLDGPNARLIAAAPDLLAALDKLVIWCEDIQDDDSRAPADEMEEARAAIERATGGQL